MFQLKNSEFYNHVEFKTACFSKMFICEENREAFQKIYDWCEKPRDMCLFLGSPGVAKTYAAAALCNKLSEMGIVFRVFKEYHLFSQLRESINSGFGYGYELQKLESIPFLIIDDFGTSQATDWQKEVFSTIVDIRYESRKPTFLTSNLFLKEIRAIHHPRVYSRIADTRNTLVELDAQDLRLLPRQVRGF